MDAEQPSALSDTAPSPWWPCPECGGERFLGSFVLERGRWTEDFQEWQAFDPPSGVPTGIRVDEVECAACGHTFNPIAVFGWPSGPENGWPDDDA